MPADALIGLLPDLVLVMRRDGHVIAHGGGHGVPELRPACDSEGEAIVPPWSEATGTLIKQLVRRSISLRTSTEARFRELDRPYEARATAQGPDRAIVVVRAILTDAPEDAPDTTGERPRPELDRRGFMRRLKESVSLAALQEKSVSVAVLYIDGIADIAQIMAARVSEQILSTAILRLSAHAGLGLDARPGWYLGQIGENTLALVVDSSERSEIEESVALVCASLREPVSVGDAEFRLTVYAGVGVLGLDASSPRLLLDHARAAAAEARRAASVDVFFFSDTIKLRSLARIDMARELREAIDNRDIGFRYVARHDLRTGRVVAWVAYLRWEHPLRGEIRPAEFLRVAESTGLAVALSRAALDLFCKDFARLSPHWEPGVRISFGALREHIYHEEFLADIERLVAEGRVPAQRLELRIAEKAFVACDPAAFASLCKSGARLVVDEVGRDMGSLVALARAPLWGLQLDRAWTTAISTDDVARSVCRAGLSVANALDLASIATGVDSEAQRDALLELGFRYGTGDLYIAAPQNITALEPAPTPARSFG
jgi:EAL domain-containing protein (putative c-di-GMP-specific phosphodiesterase class I)/GGDEF domain-containing protein